MKIKDQKNPQLEEWLKKNQAEKLPTRKARGALMGGTVCAGPCSASALSAAIGQVRQEKGLEKVRKAQDRRLKVERETERAQRRKEHATRAAAKAKKRKKQKITPKQLKMAARLGVEFAPGITRKVAKCMLIDAQRKADIEFGRRLKGKSPAKLAEVGKPG